MPRKTPAQKRTEPFRKVVTRLDDKEFHRHFNEWWDSAPASWGRRWRPPVQEMGVLVEELQDLPRRAKQDGALYFTRGEDGRMMQANLYTKGNVGETGEVTVAMIEERMRACPPASRWQHHGASEKSRRSRLRVQRVLPHRLELFPGRGV